MIRRANLVITANEPAVFSERAATEGAHRTLPCPTGSALLGWAAVAGGYSTFADPFSVFHSGRVRFSNAYPLVGGKIAWPVPRLLMERKHKKGGIEHDRLIAENLVVGRPVKDDSDTSPDKTPQYDALKGFFVTADGQVVKPEFGGRLRTATEGGRAKLGQLFGFQHIDPAKIGSYQAIIEADDDTIPDSDWEKLINAFNGKSLRLGRGSGTAYGGYYQCKMIDSTMDPWPREHQINAGDPLRVWTLSDIALVDQFGAPCFAPTAEMFGLPEGSKFLSEDSAMSVRRFAPWNAHLNRRDVERQVIEAGSVLSFEVTGCDTKMLTNIVGLWREAGFGRVWIGPPMLAVKRGEHPVISEPVNGMAPELTASSSKPENDPLVIWSEAMQTKVKAMEESNKPKNNGRNP